MLLSIDWSPAPLNLSSHAVMTHRPATHSLDEDRGRAKRGCSEIGDVGDVSHTLGPCQESRAMGDSPALPGGEPKRPGRERSDCNDRGSVKIAPVTARPANLAQTQYQTLCALCCSLKIRLRFRASGLLSVRIARVWSKEGRGMLSLAFDRRRSANEARISLGVSRGSEMLSDHIGFGSGATIEANRRGGWLGQHGPGGRGRDAVPTVRFAELTKQWQTS